MDNLENQPSQPSQPAPTPAPNVEDLQAQCASLGSLLNSVLILILVLAGALDLFLMRQVKGTRADLTAARYYVQQLSRNGPAVDSFLHRLADYAKTHPDFAPLASKYSLNALPPATAMPTPGTAAPAPKKK